MGYAKNKLKPRLNGGLYKMNKAKGNNKTDFHDYINDPNEIGIEELANLFLSNKQTISIFINANIISVKRKEKRALVFDRLQSISILETFKEEGRLTTRNMYSKKRKLNIITR